MDQGPPVEQRTPAPPPGGLRILRPLRIRDFSLLFAGTAVSLLGDGIYLVAIAWQVYELSDAPTALSVVGVAWTLPMVLFLLIGGVLGDRFDRRRMMIASDAIRAVAIAGIGVLSVTGAIELWHVVALVAVYGIGEALFAPSFQAIVPEVVPREMLVQANSLQQLTEPLAFRLAGPALGGLLIATIGTGEAFLVDAASFGGSMACVAAMRPLPRRGRSTSASPSFRAELGEGWRFVRAHAWLWATLVAAALMLLFWFGPVEVLLPYVVKNEYGGGAEILGLVFAAAGVGAVVSATVIGSRGLPRRHVLWMYLAWGVSALALAGYGLANEAWVAMAIALAAGAGEGIGNITWATLMHRHVPDELLGRVSSLDWMVSIGLAPLSFAFAGPVADWVGVQTTMIGAGVLAFIAFVSFLLVPGVRAPEGWAADEPAPA